MPKGRGGGVAMRGKELGGVCRGSAILGGHRLYWGIQKRREEHNKKGLYNAEPDRIRQLQAGRSVAL